MKVKHILFWHTIVTIVLTMVLLGGCRKYTVAQWEAGKTWFKDPNGLVCRHRVAMIAKDMMERDETFDIVFGTRGKNKHVWIEQYNYDGSVNIIEPSQATTDIKRYTETARMPYKQGSCKNIVVISAVNHWLLEKGKGLYSPNSLGS